MKPHVRQQVFKELHKTYRALHWNLRAGRDNQYHDAIVHDVKQINKFYKLLDNNEFRKAARMYMNMDTAQEELIPYRVREFIEVTSYK